MNLRLLHVMTVENLLSHQFIEDRLSFHVRIQLYGLAKRNKNYCNSKDIDMSISPIEKLILTENVGSLTKVFMGKKANLIKFVWVAKYFFNVFATDLNLKKCF